MVIDQTMSIALNFTIQQVLLNLIDGFERSPDILSSRDNNRIYFMAMLKHAAKHPLAFRENGLSFRHMYFCAHKKNAKGKLVSVKARFEFEKEEEEK